MKITFRINYLTCYGQQLMIDSIPGVGVALMTPKQNGDWELTIDSDSLPQKTFSYKYLMKDNNVSQTLYEFGDRTFCLPELASDNILVRDCSFTKTGESAVRVLPVFDLIAKKGGISERDMFNTYNMGVGMSIVVAAADADKALKILKDNGEDAYVIGEITESEEKITII